MTTYGLAALTQRPTPPRKGTLRGPHAANTKLSAQEERVLEYVRQGLRDKEIATKLNLSVETAKVYLWRARVKLGARASSRRSFTEARERERLAGFTPCEHCIFRGLARWVKLASTQVLEEEGG
jgi:DNA-binding NarL/FixJ family response regulator